MNFNNGEIMSIERIVRWYETKGEDCVDNNPNSKLIFLIINEPRDIEIITDRIYALFGSWGEIQSEKTIAREKIPDTELTYHCFSFETSRGGFTPNSTNVYKGIDVQGKSKIKRDEKLGRLKSDEAITNYIRSHYCGLKD